MRSEKSKMADSPTPVIATENEVVPLAGDDDELTENEYWWQGAIYGDE